MLVGPDAAPHNPTALFAGAEGLGPGNRRQMLESHSQPQQQQPGGDQQVRNPHRVGNGCRRSQLGRVGKDERAGNNRCDGCAERVEGLRQGQAHRGAMLGSQDDDIRVGGVLQGGYARAHDKDGSKEERKIHQPGRGKKQQTARNLNKQGDDHGSLVPDDLDQLGGGRGEDEVGQEKR